MAKSYQETLAEMMTASTPATMSLRRTVSEDTAVMALAEEAENWILHTGYKTTDINEEGLRYEDSNISYVDELKNVSINQNQVNLTQESDSQYIPFEMSRYYDGIDLTKMKITIYYENIKKGYGISDAVNVRYSNTKIRFGWVVPYTATALAGVLKVEIHVEGQSPLYPNDPNKRYLLKTKPNSDINIIESLQGEGQILIDETWANNVLEDMEEAANQAYQAELKAKSYAQQAEDIYNNTNDAIENAAIIAADTIREELETTHYTREELDPILEDKADDADITNLQGQIDSLKTSVDNFDGLANFKSTYNEETGEIAFYNGEELMEGSPHTLMTNPTEEWSNAYKETIQNELVKPISDKLDQHMSDSDTRMTNIEGDVVKNTAAFDDYYKKSETLSKDEIEQKIADIDVSSQFDALEQNIAQNYYNKTESDGKYAAKSVESDILAANQAITKINEELASIDKSPNAQYITTYNEPYTYNGIDYTGENALVLYEIFYKDTEQEVRNIVSVHIIQGGSGSSSANTIVIDRITASPLVVTANDKVIIEYKFSGTDSSGDDIGQGTATWKVGNRVVKNETVYTGERSCDLTEFLSVASDQKVTLTITDEIGTMQTKTWYVFVVDVKLESKFDDTKKYPANVPVTLTFTPYGAVDKTVHVLMDGKEIGTVASNKAAAGLSSSYSIPAQSHGTHLVEIYMTADINNNTVESNHIMKDIIWYDETSDVPVISTVQQEFKARQYEATNITFTVYDPSTETPEVNLRATYVNEDGETVEEYNSTLVMSTNTDFWQFKSSIIGEHTLTITCGETVKTLKATITELGIEVNPITAGLAFDFNPVGYSNNDANRLWSDGDVAMTVSDNFDWVNGGYQIDENGDQYFCVKAGTTAEINYNLFADDAKANGKEFKVIFKTTNIRKRDTSFITCLHDGIGLDMKIENASVCASDSLLKAHYCENEIIEYEFNINKLEDIMVMMTYEDGTPSIPTEYTETSSFKQTTAQPITIGSDDCDVLIYRMKAYSTSLSDLDVLNNFIADARNAEEMIVRYNRNQIYNEDGKIVSTASDGSFNADTVMKSNPKLRYIFLEVPRFTEDKDDKVDGCTVYFRYPSGLRPQDNWTCTGMRTRGQGTSSNLYGYSGRNIDLCMDRDTSVFTWTDEEGNTVQSSTITLTDTSFPTDYLNIKVNIASSENANNAESVRRFNQFQPFLRYIRKKDSRIKDTMEFYNCVVFIREANEDLSTHTEFNDTNWHFYAIGNVGDSKKTDDTRVNNPNDPRECIVEIMDADVPLGKFPTGKDGNTVCPVDEWKEGNTAYDILHSTDYVYDEEGEFESFGGESYEFRYEMDGITEEQRELNINAWRDLYKFIVTSSDEEFYANLKNYFVIDSALYFYLFTERYTMVDNRCKNSFWHYGKVYISNAEAAVLGETEASYYIIDDEAAVIRDGYRWDLTQFYDADTQLGIDNTGDLVFSYGKEDTDYYVDGDPSSDYVFRVADSVFFCRIRDLFSSELAAMFRNRESLGAWSSTSLINQWDNSQAQFCEELWRLDFERKYRRTYLGTSVDNSIPKGIDKTFLIGRFFGRKKYHRRMFEINQEMYFATKYFGIKATEDVIWIRGNVPLGSSITQNYDVTITVYSDMYGCIQYGSTGTPINVRLKAGETYTFKNDSERMDFIYIYAASYIQAIGDLSRCYPGDNNFSKGIRLQSLVIGSTDEGYENTFMKEILVANNTLLEYLDLRNVSGINTVMNLSGCSNLKELYAEGTNATGVIFANGGLLRVAHLPSVSSLSMKNLNYITDLDIKSYENLKTLIIENCPTINSYNMINLASALNELRLIGINWGGTYAIQDSAILDRLLNMWGINNLGFTTDVAVVTGYIYMSVIKEHDYYLYKETWNDLTIEYGSMTPQFAVTFVNDDGTVIEVQHVDMYSDAVDPTTRAENPIIPTKESTVSTDYTFSHWDTTFTNIQSNKTVKAVYTEKTREYTVKYVQTVNNTTVPLQTKTVPYGSYSYYEGTTPSYTGQEQSGTYYLFNRWDKSGYVDGDKTITAVFDKCTYVGGYFEDKELTDLSPVEIYALTRLVEDGRIGIVDGVDGFKYIDGTNISEGDYYSFRMGSDFDFDDLADKTFTIIDINEPKTFSGATGDYYDTGINILEIDRDFVLAVDYEFAEESTSGNILMECFYDGRGFKLLYNENPLISWSGSKETVCGSGTNREMLVLRHIAGETGLHVYTSSISNMSVGYIELESLLTSTNNLSLIFGCGRRNASVLTAYASGTIHWAKVWYADLGDNACRKLASYIHEEVNLRVAGFQRYFLEDINKLTTIDFIGSKALYTKKRLHTGSNIGGWASTELNTWLNSRFYDGMPIQVQQLLKKVRVKSRSGGMSDEITYGLSYVYIPAMTELFNDTTYSSSPYLEESDAERPVCISHMTDNTARSLLDANGMATEYWTRSPSDAGSSSGGKSYFHYVNKNGGAESVGTSSHMHGIVVEFSI